MSILEDIETIIKSNLPDAMILVHNINNDGEHFEAVVISATFNGMPLLKQHQQIMGPLREAFDERVHALGLKTFSLDNWKQKKDNHPMIESLIKEKYGHDK